MVLITDIVFQFITTELVPRIVTRTLELNKDGSSLEDIVKDICASDFSSTSKVPVKRSSSSRAAHKTEVKVEPQTIDDYMANFKDAQVCEYVYTRGEKLKNKICCKPVNLAIYNKDDKNTHRCTTHENSDCKVDIESLLGKSKTPSKKDQVSKVQKLFPKGAPDVLNSVGASATPASASSTPTTKSSTSGLGKIGNSIKDMIAQKSDEIESKTPEKEIPKPEKKKLPPKTKSQPAKERTPEKEPTPTKERTPTPEKPREPSPEPRVSTSSSCHQTPLKLQEHKSQSVPSERESTPDNFASTPLDENGEEYYLTPSHPSAQEYLWMMFSEHEVLVFGKEFDACYGVYKTEDKINPDKDLKISSAWKKLLKIPNTLQEAFVTERGIEIKTFA